MCCCLMIRGPPSSTRPYTLCPYTTRFRAVPARLAPPLLRERLAACRLRRLHQQAFLGSGEADGEAVRAPVLGDLAAELALYGGAGQDVAEADRKSTRLNSSH